MGELSNLELAKCLRDGSDWHRIRGISYISKTAPDGYLELCSYEECCEDPAPFGRAFRTFYENNDPLTAKGLFQKHGDRFLVQNPPQRLLTSRELDSIHMSDYMNAVHPYYAKGGVVKAMDTIKNSITSHRGCYGECSFCAIAVHHGRTVVSRTPDSIVREAEMIASRPGFNGYIYDVGGPTANMYGIECTKKCTSGACKDKKCLYPRPCMSLRIDHSSQIELLRRIMSIPGVKKVFVNSGIRYDMIEFDKAHGMEYLEELVVNHISGQMKIAPEHISRNVLANMGKPGPNVLLDFKDHFDKMNRDHGKNQFLTYYFMAAHPGCTYRDMTELSYFVREELHTNPEQIQIFTPTPSTVSTMMYYTGRDYLGMNRVFCEQNPVKKQKQKNAVLRPHNDCRR